MTCMSQMVYRREGRLTDDLVKHLNFELVDTAGLTPEQLQDINYTSVLWVYQSHQWFQKLN